jgi:hypothetical protein
MREIALAAIPLPECEVSGTFPGMNDYHNDANKLQEERPVPLGLSQQMLSSRGYHSKRTLQSLMDEYNVNGSLLHCVGLT